MLCKAAGRVAVFAVMLVAYGIYDALGLVSHTSIFATPFVVVSFIAIGTLMWFKPRIDEVLNPHMKWVKPVLCCTLVCIALFVLERSYVAAMVITLPYIVINLLIVGCLFCVVFFTAQQTRVSAIVFLVVCFIFGLANYFVIQFKGQPVMPADFFALGTAAAVSDGYIYAISDGVAYAFVALGAGIALATFLPKPVFNRKHATVNISASLACILVFGIWFSVTDIEEDYESYFYMFRPQLSYADYGSVLCFLSLVQQIDPAIPEGYSTKGAEHILEPYTSGEDSVTSSPETPSIIVVMNETFADLSTFPKLADSYEGPTYYQSIDDAALKGNAYVSVLGAGTCNSEFEFLTGSTMASMGSGYPYMNYDLSLSENLAEQLGSLGYDTVAIHPDKATNWKRNIVYDDFGFSNFIDKESFAYAAKLRGFTRDEATYRSILDILNNDSDPQFIFNVTMQNHGGYSKGDIPESVQVNAPIDGLDHPELDEYLSTIKQSDEDLSFLIESLRDIDRPVIVCFFGDHQPSIMQWLYEYLGYDDLEGAHVEQLQAFYQVPYMIWANYDIDDSVVEKLLTHQDTLEQSGVYSGNSNRDTEKGTSPENEADDKQTLDDMLLTVSATPAALSLENEVENTQAEFDLSLNYLAAFLVQVADLPTTPYQNFLINLHSQMPIINANGFMDTTGSWHSLDDTEVLAEARNRYEIVQYNHVFHEKK